MAKKPKTPRVNRRDLTLVNLRAYKRDLKIVVEALKSVDKRLHLVEANLAALMVPPVDANELRLKPTDDGA